MIGNRSKAMVLASALSLGLAGCLLPPVDSYSVGVVVTSAPPPDRYEVYGVMPGPDFVWIRGYWQWSGVEYVWISGRWEQPPRGYRHYDRGSWHRTGHGWRYREGRWKR